MKVTIDHLRDLVPLNNLDTAGLERVLAFATPSSFKQNHEIYPIESDDGFVYYLLEGSVALADRQGREAKLSADTKQARYAFGTLKPRPANARVSSNIATVLRFNYQMLEEAVRYQRTAHDSDSYLLAEDISLGLSVEEFSLDSTAAHDDPWFLAQMTSRLFRHFSPSFMTILLQRMRPVEVRQGDMILDEGASVDSYTIIREGFCKVSYKGHQIAMQKPMDTIGEYELITGEEARQKVEMLTDGILMRMDKNDFDTLLKPKLTLPLSYQETRQKLKEGAILVDVRGPEKFNQGRLVRSINIPLIRLKDMVSNFDTNRIYIVCSDRTDKASVGAFIMAIKGYNAFYLSEPEIAFDRILAK